MAIGLFAAFYAQRYEFGELSRMGAGFFPVVLGLLLAVLGAFIMVPAFFRHGAPITLAWPSFFWVMLSLVVFALSLKWLGLMLATVLAVVLSSMPERQTTWRGRLYLSVGVAVVTYLVFGLGLRMTLPIFPWNV